MYLWIYVRTYTYVCMCVCIYLSLYIYVLVRSLLLSALGLLLFGSVALLLCDLGSKQSEGLIRPINKHGG